MNALLTYLKLKLRQFANKVSDVFHVFLDLISWPVWYFAGMTILLFVIATEMLGTWSAWAYLMIGFVVWGFKRTR